MDSEVKLLLERADNTIIVAKALNKLSEGGEEAVSLKIPEGTTFYSLVISQSYYAIFYSAKAYLSFKGINLGSKQGQHQLVYFKFKDLVKKKIIDEELLKIYEEVKIKAEDLLEILSEERDKRKKFTYEIHSQANKEPAEQSLNNYQFFISHIKKFIEKGDD